MEGLAYEKWTSGSGQRKLRQHAAKHQHYERHRLHLWHKHQTATSQFNSQYITNGRADGNFAMRGQTKISPDADGYNVGMNMCVCASQARMWPNSKR